MPVYKYLAKNLRGEFRCIGTKKNKYYRNCESRIWEEFSKLTYSQFCNLKDMARNMLEEIDKEFFGVYVDGACVGYDFCRYNR